MDNLVFEAVCKQASNAANAQREFARANTQVKNKLILTIAQALEDNAHFIAQQNEIDIQRAKEENMSQGKLDRLLFDEKRVPLAAQGMKDVALLSDPVGEIVRGNTMPNGIRLTQVRVPIGVIGMIYEARPNVTVDVTALCLKAGNAVILRGGHAAEHTNAATISVIQQVLVESGFDKNLVTSVDEFGREGAQALMQARGFIDLLVPRGGKNLIQYVVTNSKVPVIETGAGNCHIYVDKSADFKISVPIIINAKTQRIGVCNATEKLIVHKDIAKEFLPIIAKELTQKHVALHADEQAYEIIAQANIQDVQLEHATVEDWDTEYLDYIIGVKVVDSLESAVEHINTYSTGHTESILSQDYEAIEYFTHSVDAAVVFANASTRFTDGSMFGFGAELGISTQKMHARGPMGLQEITTTKWIGYGSGQVRL
ncbi:MAG: glutamate-5-semialdehyde dehydrogenase [Bifidobacteriaceae bacterium]|nr:glutamate-5-semialdehyde dehydrogenase [Bifidobacteriaceae bacterium]